MSEKKIKNQAWIYNDVETTLKDENDPKKGYTKQGTSLKQEIITVVEEGNHCTSTAITIDLVEDVWDTLSGEAQPDTADAMDCDGTKNKYYKNSKGNYFFWKYNMTGINEDEDSGDVTVRLECPQPTYDDLVLMEVFESVEDINATSLKEAAEDTELESDYLKYWLSVFAKAAENVEDKYTIQKSKINYPKAEMRAYSDTNELKPIGDGDSVEVGEVGIIEERNVQNNDLASLANLLSLF